MKEGGKSAPEHTEEPRWASQAGFAFVSLFCAQLSVPLLTSAAHETTLKQVAEKEGRKLQCLLRVSRSPGCFVRASCSPSMLEPVTFQRGTTLLPGTARAYLLLSCVMSNQAAGCWGAALFSLPNQFKPSLSSLLSMQWCSYSCLWSGVCCMETIKDTNSGISGF